MHYRNYRNKQTITSLNIYYTKYSSKNVNLTINYIDDYRMSPIANRFQRFIYEEYKDIADVPVDIINVIDDPNKKAKQ